MFRSIAAILTGLVFITAASFAIEAAVDPFLLRHAPDQRWIVTMAYTLICVAAGGYLAAFLARRSFAVHGLIVGLLQAALTIPAWIAYPKLASTPQWIAGTILVIPAAWLGGFIQAKRGNIQ